MIDGLTMFCYRYIVSFAALFTTIIAQVNFTEVDELLPSCAVCCQWVLDVRKTTDKFKLKCSLQQLIAAQCQPADFQSCLCSNTTLQNDLFVCVLASCNNTEQSRRLFYHRHIFEPLWSVIEAATVSQTLVCAGIPVPSRSAEIIRTVIILSAFAFPIIILRCISRVTLTYIWWDDWAMIIGGVSLSQIMKLIWIRIWQAIATPGSHDSHPNI